ncbi:MAG: hypothetical protein RDV48_15410 [Candidatus Eremiobacteraeota bacterium]|nr:hypothetical protein [Candidatus Eremiobacteraeota bacterium]
MKYQRVLFLIPVLLLALYLLFPAQGLSQVKPAKTPPPGNEVKQYDFEKSGFSVTVPVKSWKIEKDTDDSSSLELTLTGKGIVVQILSFQKTMATVPELIKELNRTFKKNFSGDGAQDYAMQSQKDWRAGALAGKRVIARFLQGKEVFFNDQIYAEGDDRVVVFTLIAKKPLYDAAKKDFEKMAGSLIMKEPAMPGSLPGE